MFGGRALVGQFLLLSNIHFVNTAGMNRLKIMVYISQNGVRLSNYMFRPAGRVYKFLCFIFTTSAPTAQKTLFLPYEDESCGTR